MMGKMTEHAYCCYHDDQESFKSAFSEFRKSLHIPQSVSKACAMSVCSCRKGGGLHRTPMSKLEVLEYQGMLPSDSDLMDALGNTESSDGMTASSRQFITDVLFQKRKNAESAFRFVCVLKMALDFDYTLLKEEQADRKSKMPPKKEKQVNLHVARRCIIAKRKRQAGDRFYRNIGLQNGKELFKFDSVITELLQKTSKLFKPCIVEINKDRELQCASRFYTGAVPITAWCENKKLGCLLKELQEKFYELGRTRICPVRHRYRPKTNYYDKGDVKSMNIINDITMHDKENKAHDYGKKVHMNFHRPETIFDHGTKNTVKCYNCQQPEITKPHERTGNYVSALPSSSTAKNKNVAEKRGTNYVRCRYHPGFVANKKWSCCGEDADEDIPLTLQHSTHGCAQSDAHKWLYQNKSCPKSTVSSKHGRLKDFDGRPLSSFIGRARFSLN